MKDQQFSSSRKALWLSRPTLLRNTTGAVLGAGLFHSKWAFAEDDEGDSEPMGCVGSNPVPGGVKALSQYGFFAHHNPLNPANPLANIHDPSQITGFDGFVLVSTAICWL